ncbi:FRG domain-containing protein [Pseudomonas marginalis]|nr:FRG domain-containing protein [Pseudomonas marginalis]
MGSVTEVHFELARDLIDYISPLNSQWDEEPYIFRGQPSDEYKLTPSICRQGEGSFGYGLPGRMFDNSTAAQIHFELDVIKKFLEGCERSGLSVPGYSEQVKSTLFANKYFIPRSYLPWPPKELYEIMAAAQHYDVPTRLLDWTDRSFVACYFAASSVSLEINDRKMPRIAIWALSTKFADSWKTIKIIRTPGGTSRNQAAQSGLFTAHTLQNDDFSPFQTEALEDVEEICSIARSARPLIKMTLPVEQAPDLLKFCSQLGVDATTLFPGYHGAAKNVRDWVNVGVGVRASQALIDDYQQDAYDD